MELSVDKLKWRFWVLVTIISVYSCQSDPSEKLIGKWEGKQLVSNEDTLHFFSSQRHPKFEFRDSTFVLINRFGIKQQGTYTLDGRYLKFKSGDNATEIVNQINWYNDDDVIELIMMVDDKEQKLFLQRLEEEHDGHDHAH